jgi:thiol-disulfide isomerase/thioredoxin
MWLSRRYELHAKTLFSMTLFDVLGGFTAFVVVMVVCFFYQDIRPFLLATCLAYMGAGFYRAGTLSPGTQSTGTQSKRLLLKALFVAVGGILPAISMNMLGVALTGSPFLAFFLLACSLNAALGTLLRSLISREKMRDAVVTGSIWTLAILAIIYIAVPDWMDRRAYLTVSREVAPFRIQTLTGTSVASEEWKGRVVVLILWATWCSPCHAELPEIQALQDKYRGNPNVLIFALDSGTGGDTAAKAQAYLERKKLTLTGTIDSSRAGGDSWGQAAKSLGAKGIPSLYILDRSGWLKAVHLGYDSSEHLSQTLSRQIDQLL